MSASNKQQGIVMSELQYYFDAVERDSLDRMSHTRRSTEVLAIRDKLLTMPDRDFVVAVQTIKNILSPSPAHAVKEDESKSKRKEAAELYEKTRQEKTSTLLKVSSL